MVAVQPGGDRVPFFCVHGARGNVLNFRELARAMSPEQPFYGLQALGVDGEQRPHATIEAMASAYLAEVREIQPEGPYLLGGYSGGGLVALRMAQTLTAAGSHVGLLALIDTYHPKMAVPRLTLRSRLERMAVEGPAYLARGLHRRFDEARTARELRALDAHLGRSERVPFALREAYLVRSFRLAVTAYEPEPWPGRAVLFRAEQVPYLYRAAASAYGWDRVILGGVEVVVVPGTHHTLLLRTNAGPLARSLDAAVARAQPL